MIAIRGATTLIENTEEQIKQETIRLIDEIIRVNNLKIDSISTIIFSCTDDITKEYPGKFVREFFNLDNVAIMHFNEMKVENSLKMCIRLLMLLEGSSDTIKYVYLNEAKNLRKDLFTNFYSLHCLH